MINLTVRRQNNGITYISKLDFILAVSKKLGEKQAAVIWSKFEKIMIGSAIPTISECPLDLAVYPIDMYTAAKHLDLSIRFIDDSGAEIRVIK